MTKDILKPIVIYFHGYPGGFDEVSLVAAKYKEQLVDADRFLTGDESNHEEMIARYVAGI